MKTPKVLIIGQPFNNNTGGGITLSNLFRGWDSDKLAVVCSAYLISENTDTEQCPTYYQLGEKEHVWSFPFNLLQRKYSSGVWKKPSEIPVIEKPSSHRLRMFLIFKVFYPLMNFLGWTHTASKIKLSEDLCRWLDKFNPDVIYAQTTSRKGIHFCLAVTEYLRKPLVFHMMDDWQGIICKGIFKRYWRKKIDAEFRILLDKASLLMSISDEMATAYKNRYGKEFVTFHNTINLDFWKQYQRTRYDLALQPIVLYAGRIGLGIDSSLELVAQALEHVVSQTKLQIRFVIQSQDRPAWVGHYPHVEHKSFVEYSDLPRIFASADLLLLPYDFSKQAVEYISFSMPTKVPEYMISGTPIVVFAPKQTALVKYASDRQWATVITQNDLQVLVEAFVELFENDQLRENVARNAILLAECNHNSEVVNAHFREMMWQVASCKKQNEVVC